MSKQRLLIVALFISLLANAFFIGFGATRLMDDETESRRGGILQAVSARLTQNLDEAARQQVADALQTLDPQYQQLRQGRRDNYQKLRQLLSDSEPDQEAISTVLADMRDQSSDLVATVHEEAVETILKLPADRRAQISGDGQ
ncbi:MAG: periplasmic heavy metal sensor [Pseudomonadota bacterium]